MARNKLLEESTESVSLKWYDDMILAVLAIDLVLAFVMVGLSVCLIAP